MGTCISDPFAAVPVFHVTLHFDSVPQTFSHVVMADYSFCGLLVLQRRFLYT